MITALDLIIIIDTLHGSLSVRDNGSVFRYLESARKETLDKMFKIANETNVNVGKMIVEDKS